MPRELTRLEQIERSVLKKFRAGLWGPFMTAVTQYRLLSPGDRIAVCVSGGKDSTLLAVMLRLLSRHSEIPFELRYVVMDPGYRPEDRKLALDNAALLELPVTVFESDIFRVVEHTATGTPCYLCARMRRGHLYHQARALGCNKIALGHHFSDVTETVLMGLLYSAQYQTMMPKLHSQNFAGLELIRPLYRVHEDAIAAWGQYNGLTFLRCACPVAERNAQGCGGSKRQEIKHLIHQLRQTNPDVEKNIFNSIHRVNLETVIGYKQGGKEYSFLDGYKGESNT